MSVIYDNSGSRDLLLSLTKFKSSVKPTQKKWTKDTIRLLQKSAKRRGGRMWDIVAKSIRSRGNKITIHDSIGNQKETGGIIRAKGSGWLRIRLGNFSSKDEGDAVIKSGSGNLIVIKKTGNGFTPIAVLKKQVKSSKQPWISTDKEILDEGQRALNKTFDKAGL